MMRYPFKAEVLVHGLDDVTERVWLTDYVEANSRNEARELIDDVAVQLVDERGLVDWPAQRAEVLSLQWQRYNA